MQKTPRMNDVFNNEKKSLTFFAYSLPYLLSLLRSLLLAMLTMLLIKTIPYMKSYMQEIMGYGATVV